MGNLSYTLGEYGADNARTLMGTEPVTSDAFTSSTSAASVTDGGGAISAKVGQVFRCSIDEAAWIAFGGRTATVGNDFHMNANTTYWFEIAPGDAGAISVIDVA